MSSGEYGTYDQAMRGTAAPSYRSPLAMLPGAVSETADESTTILPRPETEPLVIPWWAWIVGGAVLLLWLDRRLTEKQGRQRHNPDADDDEEDEDEDEE